MATIEKLQDIEVWRLARTLACEIGELLKEDRFKNEFGIIQQMKNSSGSLMDNIAEGFGRGSKNEFINSLSYSKGSAEELKSQLFRCFDLHLIETDKLNQLETKIDVLIKKIASFIHYLNSTEVKGQKFRNRI